MLESRCGNLFAATWSDGEKRSSLAATFFPSSRIFVTRLGIIDRGVLEVNAEVSEVMRRVREHVVLVVQLAKVEQHKQVEEILNRHEDVRVVEVGDGDELKIVLESGVDDYSRLLGLLIENGIAVRQFREEDLNLESAFMALTKGTAARM